MDLLSQIVARAKSNKQRIVLPEAEEERTLCAADKALADDIADIILIGNPAKVDALAKEKGLKNIGKATLIDPENYEKSEELAEKLAEIRKSKGMTIEEARKLVKNPLYLGCMIIKTVLRPKGLMVRFLVHFLLRVTLCVQLCRLSSVLLVSHVSAVACC